MLSRHRPDVPAERRGEIVHRLIHAYPSHGFVIDADELEDLGLATRMPDSTERSILDATAMALAAHANRGDVFELVDGSPAADAERPAAVRPRILDTNADSDGDTVSTHSTRGPRPRHRACSEPCA